MGSPGAEARRIEFGHVLAETLGANGLTQVHLAKTLGCTQRSVSAWINGRAEPAAELVFEIERALSLPPGYLSRLLGYLPVEAVKSAATVEEAVALTTVLDESFKPMLLAVYRELRRLSRQPQTKGNGARTQPPSKAQGRGKLRSVEDAPPAARRRRRG